MSVQIDVTANRCAQSWTRRDQLKRVLWALCLPLFRYSPRPMWGWRRFMLRNFGASVAEGVRVHPTVRIMMPWHLTLGAQAAVGDHAILYALGRIEIGARATVSQYAHLCAGTHDVADTARKLIKAPIVIGPDAWICADAFVGPHVNIGTGAILGARGVAMCDLGAGKTGFGNPMRIKGDAWPI